MLELSVQDHVVESYSRLFLNVLKVSIKELYNPEFIIHSENVTNSFAFLEKEVVVLRLEDGTVTDLEWKTYSSFIKESIVLQLCGIERLPPRLKRYRRLGIERFKNEIKNELQNGNIVTSQNIAVWERYDIRMLLNEQLQLVAIS